MTILKAYLHKVEKTGNLHVRVYQDRPLDGGTNDAFVADMHKAGSPANWYSARSEWDYPLTAACVLALQKISDKYRLNLEWSPDLIQFAQEQKRTDDYEQSIRLSIENLIKNKNLPIPAYMTNTIEGTKPPMRHQQIGFQWGLRFSGLLLAWDPGTGKSRAAIDLARGWYDYNIIRPMQQVWDGKLWGVRGGILVVTKAGMVRTWRDEFAQWQSMTALEIAGERKSKLYKGGMPAHAHVINYESLSAITHNSYDALIYDECFVAGTKVHTSEGLLNIEDVKEGDKVLSFNHDTGNCEYKRVAKVMCSAIKGELVKVKTELDTFICTQGHPFFTRSGYVPAIDLHTREVRCENDKDSHIQSPGRVRGVQSDIYAKEQVPDSEGMPKVQVHLRRDENTTGQAHKIRSTNESKKPHVDGRCAREGQCVSEDDRAQAYNARREWKGADEAGTDVLGNAVPAGSELGAIVCADNAGRQGFDKGSSPLQDRYSASSEEDSSRDRRLLTPDEVSEGARSEKDRVAMWARVESVSVLKQGSRGECSATDRAGVVFNLEVEDNHNYYVGSVPHLVHNCHSCSNASGFTENSLKLAQGTRRRVGLTGTPIANNLESAFYQMLIIDGGKALGSAKTKFLEEYFRSERHGPGGEKNIAKQGALEAVSERMARCTYFLKKEEVLDLPLKTHTPVYLEMTPDQERYYNQVRDDYLVYIQDTQVTIAQAAGRLMKLRQVCQGFIQDDNDQPRDFTASKVDALVDMLKGKLGGRKVVVWAVFTHEINMLCHRLVKEGIGYVRMDGTVTSKKQRDAGLALWNSNSAVTVFVGQIQLGVGITLHAKECMVPCFDCVYLGIDYSFINWTQSQDRIHRIGQKYPCSYTYLLTKDGIDRNIYRSLQAKANTSQAVYKAGKEFYSSLVTGNEPNLAAMEAA